MILIASNILSVYWGISQYLLRLEENDGKIELVNEGTVRKYMPVARSIFFERKEEFETLSEIFENKRAAYGFYVNNHGLWNGFVEEKDHIVIPSKFVSFTEEERKVVEDFFRGYDFERLDMWKISGSSNMATFTLFSKGKYEIVLTRGPGRNATSWQRFRAFAVEVLEDDWVMLALRHAQETEWISIWNRVDGVTSLASPQ